MQFAKDSFFLALQQRLAALNSARTVTLNGATVPAILVVRPDGRDGLTRLHQAGVWFAVDPQAIGACISN